MVGWWKGLETRLKLIWPCLIVLYPRAEPCSVTFELLLELSIAFLTLSLAPLGSRLCPSDVAHPGFLQVVLSGKICQLVALPICAKGSRGGHKLTSSLFWPSLSIVTLQISLSQRYPIGWRQVHTSRPSFASHLAASGTILWLAGTGFAIQYLLGCLQIKEQS